MNKINMSIPLDQLAQDNNISGIDEILSDKEFQKILKNIADETNDDIDIIQNEADRHLNSIYASHDKISNQLFINGFKHFIDNGFEKKMDVNIDELRELTEIMKTHSVAFITSHKSYLDLIILFIVISKYELKVPYIFSGANLNLPIIGDIVKQSGIIFMRRTTKDDVVYKATLKQFIKYLTNKKSHFAWSIEGGRSRTGKLGNPKYGILKYISAEPNIRYVPVSIVYDLIPDLDDMVDEIQGRPKKDENLDWLVNYFRDIFLRYRGRISVRFDTKFVPNGNMENKKYLEKLGTDIMNSINNITPITSGSLICMSLLSRPSMSEKMLKYNIVNLINIINENRGNNDLLVDRYLTIARSVEKGLRMLLYENIVRKIKEDGENHYIINHAKYFQASYYSNISIHHFYHLAFIELGKLRNHKLNNHDEKEIWKEVLFLKKFFEYEFFYPDTFKTLINKNYDKQLDISMAPAVLGNSIVSYKVIAKALMRLDFDKYIEEKEFLDYCLFLSEELYWSGEIKKIESISVPFLQIGIKLIKTLQIWPGTHSFNKDFMIKFHNIMEELSDSIDRIISKNSRIMDIVYEENEENVLTKEILNGERGPHIGAFFDLDQTLINGFSALSFAKNRIKNGKLTSREAINQVCGLINYIYDKEQFEEMLAVSTAGIKGIKEKEFIDLGGEKYLNDIKIYEESYELIAAHRAMGHTVCIISAAISYQVEPIAKKLGIDIIECTRLEVENERFTGNFIKPCCWGEGKAIAGRKLSQIYNLDLDKTYFYTDSNEDIPLLELVGNPRPINPNSALVAESENKQWPIKYIGGDQDTQMENILRTGVSFSMIIPAAINAYQNGGINEALMSLVDIVTNIGGVMIKIENEEIANNRPALFIANHQSFADIFVSIKVIKKDCVGIAKKEVKKYPIFGDLLTEAGTIFIDNTNREKAIKGLKPAVKSLKKGNSILIFPEGTRSFDKTLGPFKKGAFHMAMQSKVPLVPIVIKNSHDVMPRGTTTLIPGIIDVKVLEPIPTDSWKLEDLNDNIAMVRKLFLDELGQTERT